MKTVRSPSSPKLKGRLPRLLLSSLTPMRVALPPLSSFSKWVTLLSSVIIMIMHNSNNDLLALNSLWCVAVKHFCYPLRNILCYFSSQENWIPKYSASIFKSQDLTRLFSLPCNLGWGRVGPGSSSNVLTSAHATRGSSTGMHHVSHSRSIITSATSNPPQMGST